MTSVPTPQKRSVPSTCSEGSGDARNVRVKIEGEPLPRPSSPMRVRTRIIMEDNVEKIKILDTDDEDDSEGEDGGK